MKLINNFVFGVLFLLSLGFNNEIFATEKEKDFDNTYEIAQSISKDYYSGLASSSTTNHTEDNDDSFYHILQSRDITAGTITLKDNTSIAIDWWYQHNLNHWKSGDRLKIFYDFYYQKLTIENVESNLICWGSFISISKYDSVSKIYTSKSSTDHSNALSLKSGFDFEGPQKTISPFATWEKMDIIFIFHDTGEYYALWNRTLGKLQSQCKLIKPEIKPEKNKHINFDPSKILKLQGKLDSQVLMQSEATQELVYSLLNYSLGLNNPDMPIGVFLFLGPTGVGKTELAKVLSKELYKDQNHLIRFDMSHFTNEWDGSRLIGSAPGLIGSDEGGQLTESLKTKPQSIVLLDEIEKAHTQVRKMFLPVFDEGYINDAKDDTVSCKQVIFIMTSNLCANQIAELFNAGYEPDEVLEIIEPRLIAELSPELYDRVRPILFRPLSKDVMGNLVDLMLKSITQRLEETRNIRLILDISAKEYLAEHGFHPTFGARPLKKLIDQKVTTKVAYAIALNSIPNGSTITLIYLPSSDSWHVEF